MKLQVNDTIEFASGDRYKVIRIFKNGRVDLQATKPVFEWIPDYFPIYYSIKLQEFKIVDQNMVTIF